MDRSQKRQRRNSWTTVDDYSGAQAAFAADSNGNLFVAGLSGNDWIVGENPGGSGTGDDFKYFAGAAAGTIAADNDGHVCGRAVTAGATSTASVIGSSGNNEKCFRTAMLDCWPGVFRIPRTFFIVAL